MAVDLSVFERQKTVLDQQQLQDAFNLKKAIALGGLQKQMLGVDLPAPVQITNEIIKAAEVFNNPNTTLEEKQKAKFRFDTLNQVAKSYAVDRGMTPAMPVFGNGGAPAPVAAPVARPAGNPAPNIMSPENAKKMAELYPEEAPITPTVTAPTISLGGGGVQTIPGYDSALANRAAAKKQAETQAEYNVKSVEEPKLEFNKKTAEKDSTQYGKNQEALGGLDSMTYSIGVAKQLLPKVSMTGPVFGRAGALAGDPDYRNLQGAINSITLQAKDLYNLGSGQGFTDADRDFLQETIAGKYARAETIGLALDRMDQALKHRQDFLNKQSGDIGARYGNKTIPAAPQTDYKSKYGLK